MLKHFVMCFAGALLWQRCRAKTTDPLLGTQDRRPSCHKKCQKQEGCFTLQKRPSCCRSQVAWPLLSELEIDPHDVNRHEQRDHG